MLKETDRLFTCPYCRVKSCLLPKGVFRYVLPHVAAPGKEIVFFPYWRYRGTRFCCTENEIRHQFVDVTHQAVESSYFPASMGLRTQAMRLAFVSPLTQGRFLAPALSLQDILMRQEARFKTEMAGRKVYHQSHVGEVLSLIYAPFYIDTQVVDAILNRPVSGPLPDFFMNTLPASDPPDWQMQFRLRPVPFVRMEPVRRTQCRCPYVHQLQFGLASARKQPETGSRLLSSR